MYKVYYKAFVSGGKPKLRQINADCDNYEEARGAVMEQLHKDQETFYKPVLVLIQGGKK